ncbi:MAG: thioredoxin, partial [Proteobacteria bacterium]
MEQINNNIIDVTAEGFVNDVIEQSKQKPVLVDFWADWCQPCKNLMPLLQQLAEKYPNDFVLAKVNTDQEQELAMQVGIQSLPTVVLIKNGEIVDSFTGLKPAGELEQWLLPHLDAAEAQDQAPIDVADDQVSAFIADQNYEAALAHLQTLPKEQAIWQMMEVHLLLGDVNQAQQLLDELTDEQRKQPQANIIAARIQLQQLDLQGRENLMAVKSLIDQGGTEQAAEDLL